MKRILVLLLLIGTAATIVAQTKPSADKVRKDKIMDIVRPNQKTVGKYIDTDLCISMQERVLSKGERNGGVWKTVEMIESWKPSETALVVCDMRSNVRFGKFALALNKVVEEARRKGVTIVHVPSECTDYYTDYSQHKETKKCIGDTIGDPGTKLGTDFRKRGIKNVVLTGVAVDLCAMTRLFGLQTMKCMDMNVVLMRDMIDIIYNPQKTPFVCHYSGLDSVVEYIEKYVCPTIVSTDFIETKQSVEKSN
jgi:hypothetical protein